MILVLPLTKLDQKLGEKPYSFGVRLRSCQDDRKNSYFCNVYQVLTEGCRSVLKFHTRSSCYFSFHTVSYVSDNVYVVILQKKWIYGLGKRISGVIRIRILVDFCPRVEWPVRYVVLTNNKGK